MDGVDKKIIRPDCGGRSVDDTIAIGKAEKHINKVPIEESTKQTDGKER